MYFLDKNLRIVNRKYEGRFCSHQRRVAEDGLTDIPPYDDPLVIAGQGTIGLEILDQIGDQKVDVIFVCVGGGL